MQQRRTAKNPRRHQYPAEDGAENTCSCHRSFKPGIFLCAKQLRYNNGAAHIAAKCKSDKYQSDLIAVPNRCQRVFADKLSRHQTVRNIVKLLKNNAAKQRKTKLP